MTALIAIDPGITTGFVMLDEQTSVLRSSEEIASPAAVLERLNRLLKTGEVEHVVYEQFRMYGNRIGASKSFSDLPEVRVIGTIDAICSVFAVGIASVPAGIYKSSTAQWVPPTEVKGGHAKDAWRLGMWYQVVRQERPATIRLKSGRIYKMFYNAEGHKEVTYE